MATKRNRKMVTIWRCEEPNREKWTTRVCRELFELGKPMTTKTNLCSNMKERLDNHRLSCPASRVRGTSRESGSIMPVRPQVKRINDQSSSTARKLSVGVTARRISSARRKWKSHSVQASLIVSDNIPTLKDANEIHSAQRNVTCNNNPEQNNAIEADKEISDDSALIKPTKASQIILNCDSRKSCDVKDISLRSNGYSERLNRIIHEFFRDIPVFPNTSQTVKQKRLRVIDDFVDKIADLFIFINETDIYYNKVEQEIDECLRALPMWEPQSKQTKNGFKNRLRDTIFTLIKTYNEKWQGVNKRNLENDSRSSLSNVQNKSNENMENDIIHWLGNNLKTYDTKLMDTKKLLKKIKTVLESGNHEKQVIKAEIANILQEISPHLHFPQEKDAYINSMASELTNVLKKTDDEYNLKKESVLNHDQLLDKTENNAISQITEILFSYDDLALYDNRRNVITEIRRILKSSYQFPDCKASSFSNSLVTNISRRVNEDVYYKKKDKTGHSSSFLVLTSEQDLSNRFPPYQSTPKRARDIPTLNKAEKQFIEKVSAIISTWLDNTDRSFESIEDLQYKETVVNDITNEVHSAVKEIVQLQVPDGLRSQESLFNDIILKGIRKHDLFTKPMTDKSPQVVDLRRRILALDTDGLLDKSALLEPQQGNRQAMANVKYRNIESAKEEPEYYYQPKALDILEDNISVWMNEQPSNIYKPLDKPTRNKLMREVVTNIQDKMGRRKSASEIKKELKQWLNKILEPQKQKNIDKLAENLKNKIIKLPQDETLGRDLQKRINDSKEANVPFTEPEEYSYKYTEADKRINEFIDAFIRKNDMKDNVVNGVLKLMLRRELYKLSPSKREEVYNNESIDIFNNDEFRMEFEIAKVIHDWLKNIPFYYALLKPGPEITEFVHTLARNIADIEMERAKHPERMDYSLWLFTDISMYMAEKYDQIANDEDKRTISDHVRDLCMRISNLRHSSKAEDGLSKMVKEHMNQYHAILEKDYLKKVLWQQRITNQLTKFHLANPTLSRADVEKVLATVPLPRDDSVLQFKKEMKYNAIIHDWLHDLPLVPLNKDEEHTRNIKMQELLQKVLETEERKYKNPSDTQADDYLDDYIAGWISQLHFEKGAKVDIPALISQLRSGLRFAKWSLKQAQVPEQGVTRNSRQSKSNDPKQNPGDQMVETIENWCNDLPIKEATDDATNARKNQVATNIFQIVGSLNDDPRVANDKKKLKNTLSNKIEEQLQNLSDHESVNESKNSLKDELVNKIIEIKSRIQDITAGDGYVQELENSIDASLSDSVHRSPKHDPAYELFKKRVVMLWLLENYDNAVNFHSLKYKKMLSEEIRFLSEEVRKRNSFLADTDEIINNIKSFFYSMPPPNENALVEVIEHIKLRCEIEAWSKELPLKEALNFNNVLERDQILTILSKTLFDIEGQEESDVDDKMIMEINKWTKKLQLISGEDGNIPKYSQLLMCLLKASADSRKCQRNAESKNLIVVEETLSRLKSDELGISKPKKVSIAGPSCGACDGCGASLEQLESLTNQIISGWCEQLPLQYGVADENRVVNRTKILILHRLIRFVRELYYRPNTLNNEGLYEHHLNLELERILTQLANDRAYWEEQRNRNDRKYQLINALLNIRPLVQEATERELYKKMLKDTISSFHSSKINESTQNSILDDFIHSKNHEDDFENQEFYKSKIKDALQNELRDQDVDPLLAANHLICELSKVQSPLQSAKQRKDSLPNPVNVNGSLPPIPGSSCHRKSSSPLSTSFPTPGLERPPDLRRSLPLRFQPDLAVRFDELLPTNCRLSGFDVIRPFPLPPPVYDFTNDSFAYEPSGALPQNLASNAEANMTIPGSSSLPRNCRPSPSDIRPFPLPPPLCDFTNDSFNYQPSVREPQALNRTPVNQQNVPVREFAEQSFREENQHVVREIPQQSFRGREQIVENNIPPQQSPVRPQTVYRRPDQQNLSVRELAVQTEDEQVIDEEIQREQPGAEVGQAGRAQNGPRNYTECPEERSHSGRDPDHEYCETCERDDDCYYVPYHPSMNYMYGYF